ncbi:hypothetical protein O3P69_017179 [Scylla paramamosain]|uniref:Uncharacterized protein n=1 Tax=Scylla paramamosain TaxID=85552 RepID=A0AAW0TZ13_SCYPA
MDVLVVGVKNEPSGLCSSHRGKKRSEEEIGALEKDRLKELNLFSLETRRLRGQLIEVFKILRNFDNVDYRCLFQLSKGHIRNNGYKFELKRYNRDLCGNLFSYKICSHWNALPSDVVNSDSVEQFKTRLDKVLPRL